VLNSQKLKTNAQNVKKVRQLGVYNLRDKLFMLIVPDLQIFNGASEYLNPREGNFRGAIPSVRAANDGVRLLAAMPK